MPVSEKSKANLKRGARPGPAQGGSPQNHAGMAAANQVATGMRHGLIDPGPDEPRIVQYRRIYGKVLGLFETQLDRTRRGLKAPSRELIELSKEVRQIGDRLYDLIQAEGQATQLEEWAARLETVLREAAPKLEKAAGVRPLELPERGAVLAAANL